MSVMKRRDFLSSGALAAGGAFFTSGLSLAAAPARSRPHARLVLVILRGAPDGLAAVPPLGDRDYPRLRGEFALRSPGQPQGALPLDGFFGLHPSLGFLHSSYGARELVVFHAVASPYRERSNFDGQDVLENGSTVPHALRGGWLNRALGSAAPVGTRQSGVALGQNVPLVMRGPAEVTSWSPSRMTALDEDTLARITDLYAQDKLLSVRLADATAADAMVAGGEGMQALGAANPAAAAQAANARYAQLVQAAAGFLRQ